METIDIVLQKAVINGLIATGVLWIFWTPFIIFIAVPIVNNIIKDFLCNNAFQMHKVVNTTYGNETVTDLNKLLPNPPTTSENVIKENPSTFREKNAGLIIIFAIVGAVVIALSFFTATRLIRLNNFEQGEFVTFNIIMAIIIFGCEIGFFLGVTTSYIPFEYNQLFGQLNDKISDYLTPLANTGNNVFYKSPVF